jgi:hypothetical protein
MTSKETTIERYFASLPADRVAAMEKLYKVLKKKLPKGFEATMQYGMVTFVVPHKLYPSGYHCKPSDALPFVSIASQKNFIALYHMGIYSDAALLKWFTDEHARVSNKKLDMGKSCVRYKKPEDIPFDLIGELATKLTPQQWITQYEKALKR